MKRFMEEFALRPSSEFADAMKRRRWQYATSTNGQPFPNNWEDVVVSERHPETGEIRFWSDSALLEAARAHGFGRGYEPCILCGLGIADIHSATRAAQYMRGDYERSKEPPRWILPRWEELTAYYRPFVPRPGFSEPTYA